MPTNALWTAKLHNDPKHMAVMGIWRGIFWEHSVSDILRCCGTYSYNSCHVFSHVAITEDQEEDEEEEDPDYMAFIHLSSLLDG